MNVYEVKYYNGHSNKEATVIAPGTTEVIGRVQVELDKFKLAKRDDQYITSIVLVHKDCLVNLSW